MPDLTALAITKSPMYGFIKHKKNSRKFFSTNNVTEFKLYGPGVMPSPTLQCLYRVDNIEYTPERDNKPAILKFNPFEILCFRIAELQGVITAKDVMNHSGSTKLIGTTSSKEVALKLSSSWKRSRNAILEITPVPLQGTLIDVEGTIAKNEGRSFYTNIRNEHEHSLTILPISAIKGATLFQNGQTVINPLYIEPTPEVVKELQTILKMQLAFFEHLYLEGKSMTKNQRQAELLAIIEQTAELFNQKLVYENPFNMSLIKFCEHYGSSSNLSKELLRKNLSTKSVLDVLRSSADELFLTYSHYSKLLSKKMIKAAIESANEENGYGSTRYSYSFE